MDSERRPERAKVAARWDDSRVLLQLADGETVPLEIHERHEGVDVGVWVWIERDGDGMIASWWVDRDG